MNIDPKLIPLPDTDWKNKFKASSMSVGFNLNLTRAMLEYLCAVADDVRWDRATYGQHIRARPDNWVASEGALIKRGLVIRKTREQLTKELGNIKWRRNMTDDELAQVRERGFCVLTPAGEHVVELVKLAGMFLEADAAISKKSRRKTK